MAVYVHNFPAKVGFFIETSMAIIKDKVGVGRETRTPFSQEMD